MSPQSTRLRFALIGLVTALASATISLAQTEIVVSLGDLFTGEVSNPSSGPTEFTPLGTKTIFAAAESAHGRELWVTDGTSQGTQLLRDIYPGPQSSFPKQFTAFDGRVYFSAHNSSFGNELWVTDGTAEGTQLVADLAPGAHGHSSPGELTVVSDTLIFVATTPDYGRELWRLPSGGVPELMVDLRPGEASSSPRDLLAAGGDVAYSYYTPETGRELATTNFFNLTTKTYDLEVGADSSYPVPLAGAPLSLFFSADTSDVGRELRKLETLTENVCLIGDVFTGTDDSDPVEVLILSGQIYYTATDSGGRRLLRNPTSCVDVNQVLASIDARDLTVVGSEFLFEADGDLWISDGTPAGTSLVDSPGIDPTLTDGSAVYFRQWDGFTWFMADGGIWRTDGTAANTQLRYACDDCGFSSWFREGHDGLYLSRTNGFTGHEPWRFPTTGFSLVHDIHRDIGHSKPSEYTVLADHLYFPARADGTGRELLAWDGVASEAWVVEDLRPGDPDSNPQGLTVAGDKLFYSAFDSAVGYELRTIEDPLGTSSLVGDLGSPIIFGALGEDLLIVLDDDDNVDQLWVTSGVGATQISSFPSASDYGVYYSEPPAAVGGQLFFAADDGVHGRELWITDGALVSMVADLTPGPDSSRPDYLTGYNGRVFFGADTGPTADLWSSDGSVQNTQIVADNGIATSFEVSTGLTYVAFEEATGGEFWVTDGTPGTQTLLADLNPGPESGIYRVGEPFWGVTSGLTYFQANHLDTGVELWVTDGTAGGTRLVRDLAPGPLSSEPWFITPLPNGDIVFVAWSPSHGYELWRSNGTSVGTYLVADMYPGVESSFPSTLTVFDDWVVFDAWTGVAGREPWAYDWTVSSYLFGDGFESGDTAAW